MATERVRLVISSRVEWLDALQEVAEELARRIGFDEDGRFAVSMALREGVSNSIRHGNRLDASKMVEVSFLVHPDRLEIRIRDEGRGFDPQSLPDPLAPENLLRPGGRGVFLIRKYMDDVDLERTQHEGGEIRMVKRLRPRASTRSADEGSDADRGLGPRQQEAGGKPEARNRCR